MIRVDEKTHERLHRVAGRIQAVKGKKTTLCDAISCLLDGGTASVAAVAKKAKRKKTKTAKRSKRSEPADGHELVPYFMRREVH